MRPCTFPECTRLARYGALCSGHEKQAWPKSACHHCDNPTCWNPDHLYGGDQSTNNHDAIRRGRRPTKETAQ